MNLSTHSKFIFITIGQLTNNLPMYHHMHGHCAWAWATLMTCSDSRSSSSAVSMTMCKNLEWEVMLTIMSKLYLKF